MARTGRPTMPTEDKKRRGTYRPGRDKNAGAAGGPVAEIVSLNAPPPDRKPDDVLDDVLEHASRWLAASDGVAVALLRQLLEERGQVAKDRDDLREQVVDNPQMLIAALPVLGRSSDDLRKLDKQIVALLSELGFTPTARSRLGLAEVKAQTKVEQLRAAREERLGKMTGGA